MLPTGCTIEPYHKEQHFLEFVSHFWRRLYFFFYIPLYFSASSCFSHFLFFLLLLLSLPYFPSLFCRRMVKSCTDPVFKNLFSFPFSPYFSSFVLFFFILLFLSPSFPFSFSFFFFPLFFFLLSRSLPFLPPPFSFCRRTQFCRQCLRTGGGVAHSPFFGYGPAGMSGGQDLLFQALWPLIGLPVSSLLPFWRPQFSNILYFIFIHLDLITIASNRTKSQ